MPVCDTGAVAAGPSVDESGPPDRIRTCGILLPKQALYQAELQTDESGRPRGIRTRDLMFPKHARCQTALGTDKVTPIPGDQTEEGVFASVVRGGFPRPPSWVRPLVAGYAVLKW